MKNALELFVLGLLITVLGFIISQNKLYNKPITDYFKEEKIVLGEKNKYFRNNDFSYVQNTDDFVPDCRQDLLNIFYTAINAGKEQFTFHCGKEYDNCLKDLNNIANDTDSLSIINNFVHPFNSFKNISTKYDNRGQVTFNIYKNYSDDDIAEIENKISEIEKNILNTDVPLEEKIKKAHNYIIDNTVYDSSKKNNAPSVYKSDTAYGPLIQGYAVCSGYTDAMQLILEKLNVENFKVSSYNHIWNAVKINNSWKHLDLTWDDPVSSDNMQYILEDYYLIDSKQLMDLADNEHKFNLDIYKELK